MKVKLLIVVIAALLFGAGTGYLGAIIDHHNHAWFGTSYSQWRLEWLALPSLPGQLIAELRTGYDWRADEMWSHRHAVIISNALFWCLITLFFMVPRLLQWLWIIVRRLLRSLRLGTDNIRTSGGIPADEY